MYFSRGFWWFLCTGDYLCYRRICLIEKYWWFEIEHILTRFMPLILFYLVWFITLLSIYVSTIKSILLPNFDFTTLVNLSFENFKGEGRGVKSLKQNHILNRQYHTNFWTRRGGVEIPNFSRQLSWKTPLPLTLKWNLIAK